MVCMPASVGYIASDLGFTINWHKFTPPSQCITLLGLNIDAIRGIVHIPEKKMQEITDSADLWSNKQTASKKELQSLARKLAWAAKCAKAIPLAFNP